MLVICAVIYESRVIVGIAFLVLRVHYCTFELFKECLVKLRLARLESKLLIYGVKFRFL